MAAMEGALAFHGDTLKDKRMSIEGFGNVSQAMVRHLFEHHDQYKVKSLYATDINKDALKSMEKIKNDYPKVDIDFKVDIVPFGDSSGTLAFPKSSKVFWCSYCSFFESHIFHNMVTVLT